MPQGISLAGGYAAEGAGLGLEKLIEQRLLREKFLEAQRQAQAQEALQQQRHALDQQQFGYMQRRDTADREMRTRERAEDRTEAQRRFDIERSEFDTAAQERQFNREMGVKEKGEEREMRQKERAEDRAFESSERAKDRALRASVGSGRGATKIVQGTDDQGRPTSFLIDQEGNILKSFGKPLSAAERTQQIDADAAAKAVTDIESLLKEEYVGPVQGRLGKVSTATGFKLTPERAKFSAAVAHMKNAIIKEITGAAVGVQEEGRIMGEIPDVTDPPETFRAKLEMTKRNRQYLQSRIAERTGGAPMATGTERKVGDRKTFPNGNVGVWDGARWVKQ